MHSPWPVYEISLLATNKNFLEKLKGYSDYYVIVDKTSAEFKQLRPLTTAMGFWIADKAVAWGINAEDWYWRSKRKKAKDANILQQMIVLAACGGAACFAVENPHSCGLATKKSFFWQKEYFPLLEEIVKSALIPSKQEVLSKIKIAAQLQERDNDYRPQFDFCSYREIFQGTYGIRHPFELIPNNNKYYLIPLLPQWDVDQKILNSFCEIITSPMEHTTPLAHPKTVKEFFDKFYPVPKDFSGNAWIAHVGNSWFVLPTSEGEYRGIWEKHYLHSYEEAWHPEIQSPEDRQEFYKLNFSHLHVKVMQGYVNPYQYIVIKETSKKIRIHIHNKKEWNSKIEFIITSLPKIKVEPEEALVKKKVKGKKAYLELRHCYGAVNIEIN